MRNVSGAGTGWLRFSRMNEIFVKPQRLAVHKHGFKKMGQSGYRILATAHLKIVLNRFKRCTLLA